MLHAHANPDSGTTRVDFVPELDPSGTYTPFGVQWTDTDGVPMWTVERDAGNTLGVINHAADQRALWVSDDSVVHVQDLAIEGTSSIDAGTLDGLESAQFLRRDVDDTHASNLDVSGTLSEGGNPVLTTADEGSLDAGTLSGNTVGDVRPTIADDATTIHESPVTIDTGQYLVASASGDTVTIDSVGGNAVSDTTTASGDGSTTTFTLTHGLGTTPAGVDVTPLTAAAAGDFYVSAVRSNDLDITYSSAPASGTDNLEWHATAFGNDGSGTHAVEVQDDSTQVDLASTLDFGAGLDVANPSDGTVTLSSPPGVDAEDSGTAVVSDTSAINFADNLSVVDDGDNTVTVTGADTYPSVSGNGSVVVSAPTDLNFSDNLSVVDDGDSTVTIHASGNADTLDGNHGHQYLRSDVDATHDTSLTVSGTLHVDDIADASGSGTITMGDDLTFPAGQGLVHESGSSRHAVLARRDGLQSLSGGSRLVTDYGVTVGADAVIAFVETDNDHVAGWYNTNNESLTAPGGVRVGDDGGDPAVPLDVHGTADFHSNEAQNFCVETRTDDPSDPEPGRLWVREDLL